MSSTSEPNRPFALPTVRGALCAIYYPPADGSMPRGDVLIVPPLAEEMNRCRAMVAMQARALSVDGMGSLVLDPFGTGDSVGDYSEASWTAWREDFLGGIEWLRRHGHGCLGLWGIRLGAIMAAQLAAQDAAIAHLLLWQPVVNGKSHYTQLLRVRIAAEMNRPDGVKTTDELRRRSTAGEVVEVSGYRIGPDLARELDTLTFPNATALATKHIAWLDVVAARETKSPHAKLVSELISSGVAVDHRQVVGPPFWQLHERSVAPELLDATKQALAAWKTDGAPPSNAAKTAPSQSDAERPLAFACESDDLVGVIHRGDPGSRRGVVIVVAGGPQYRVGAHRQFVALARRLAARGYPVLRFDLRGMGDSGGQHRGYQYSAPDIRAAVDTLVSQVPAIDEVVLFGECESASGILFYAFTDPRVKGIALVNPWVRTEEGQAEIIVKHYYADRLRSREFWRKVASGRFNPATSLVSLVRVMRAYSSGRKLKALAGGTSKDENIDHLPLPQKTAAGLRRFSGHALFLMSGNDYIAREFDEATRSSKAWEGLMDAPRMSRHVVPDADHTFSREVWKIQVADRLAAWLETW